MPLSQQISRDTARRRPLERVVAFRRNRRAIHVQIAFYDVRFAQQVAEAGHHLLVDRAGALHHQRWIFANKVRRIETGAFAESFAASVNRGRSAADCFDRLNIPIAKVAPRSHDTPRELSASRN